MFVHDKLVFLELHKTGGSHIGRLLGDTLGGEQRGKHNRITPELRDRFVLGSVRNPWDWYVSLWAFGCSGQGSVYLQTVAPPSFSYYRKSLANEMGRPRTAIRHYWRSFHNDLSKPLVQWRDCYEDPEDASAFRRWLGLLLDPQRSLDIREGYGFSSLARCAGLMTYRYVKLFSDLGDELYEDTALENADYLRRRFDDCRLVDYVIRNEQLEADFLAGLEAAGLQLDAAVRREVEDRAGKRTNTSRRRDAAFYYDAESLALVADKERLIIERHGYQAPQI